MTTNHEDPLVSPVTLTPLVPSARLRRAERELSAAQTRIHELERELNSANQLIREHKRQDDDYLNIFAKLNRELNNASRQLMECCRSLTTANERIAELENDLDKTMTIPECNAQAQARLVNAYRIESVICCVICGRVLDPNETRCSRCDEDAARDECEWYRGVQ